MGPPLGSDGYIATAVTYGFASTIRFNGAAALQRRKPIALQIVATLTKNASMGPPLFSDGNTQCSQPGLQLVRRASMGPPLFSDGNRRTQCPANVARPCFNGAAALQRRKHVADR